MLMKIGSVLQDLLRRLLDVRVFFEDVPRVVLADVIRGEKSERFEVG